MVLTQITHIRSYLNLVWKPSRTTLMHCFLHNSHGFIMEIEWKLSVTLKVLFWRALIFDTLSGIHVRLMHCLLYNSHGFIMEIEWKLPICCIRSMLLKVPHNSNWPQIKRLVLRSVVGMTYVFGKSLWWVTQRRGYLLGACFRESLVFRSHSEIGQIHFGSEAQCDHLFYQWVTTTIGWYAVRASIYSHDVWHM